MAVEKADEPGLWSQYLEWLVRTKVPERARRWFYQWIWEPPSGHVTQRCVGANSRGLPS
jgi:hypothetical protein